MGRMVITCRSNQAKEYVVVQIEEDGKALAHYF